MRSAFGVSKFQNQQSGFKSVDKSEQKLSNHRFESSSKKLLLDENNFNQLKQRKIETIKEEEEENFCTKQEYIPQNVEFQNLYEMTLIFTKNELNKSINERIKQIYDEGNSLFLIDKGINLNILDDDEREWEAIWNSGRPEQEFQMKDSQIQEEKISPIKMNLYEEEIQ